MINRTERLLKALTNNTESYEETEHDDIYNPSISRRRQLDQEFKALRRVHSALTLHQRNLFCSGQRLIQRTTYD